MMELKIKALSDKVGRDFPAPHYATDGAAAMDLCACLDEPVTLQPGERRVIPSGIAIALPSKDYVALVFARSGLGIRKGIALSNGVGVIDSDYRGECFIALHNDGMQERTIRHGDRIAQLVLLPFLPMEFEEVDALSETARGEGGFGSTGR